MSWQKLDLRKVSKPFKASSHKIKYFERYILQKNRGVASLIQEKEDQCLTSQQFQRLDFFSLSHEEDVCLRRISLCQPNVVKYSTSP